VSFPDKLSGIDRGDYFEKALDECVLGKTTRLRSSLTLRDMFVPKEETNQVLAPYWIPNATVLGNGAIFQFTPDVLEQYGVSHYYHDLKKRSLHCPYDLPLAVGLKASASFPVALPASTLQLSCPTTKTYLQLADGGLADNLGVLTAIQVFKAAASNATKVLLVIDAYSGNGLPFDRSEDSPSPARMALRTTEISLDSWRGRYRPLVEELCNHQGVEVVFLSFDELIDRRSLQSSPDASICYDLARQNSAGSQPLSPETFGKAVQQIQEAARNVPTTLSIKPREQELLLLAGRLVVCLQEGLIRQKLGW